MTELTSVIGRLVAVERDLSRMESLWKSSVDDIKSTIRGEISDLKSDQIADIRKRLDRIEERTASLERSQAEIIGGKSALGWFIRIMIAVAALAIGFIGGKHV